MRSNDEMERFSGLGVELGEMTPPDILAATNPPGPPGSGGTPRPPTPPEVPPGPSRR